MEEQNNQNLQTDGKNLPTGNEVGKDAVTMSKSEYEQLLSERDTYKTQVANGASSAQVLNAIAEVAVNDLAFEKIWRSDRKIADKVAQHFGRKDGQTLYEELQAKHGEDFKAPITGKDIEETSKKIVEENLAESELQSFLDKKGIKKGGKAFTSFMSEFDEMMNGRAMTRENVKNFSKKAFKIIMDDGVDLSGTPMLGGGGATVRGNSTPKQKQSIFETYGEKK